MLYSRHGGSLGHLKGHFDFEDIPFFHGAYGFMAFVFVVLSGTKLRTELMRPEGYYDIPYTPREDAHGHDQHGHDEHGQDQHGQHGQEESTSSDDTSSPEQSPVAEQAESEAPKQDENDVSAGSAENDASSEGGDES